MNTTTRYNTHSLPVDQYGHVSLPGAETDPYGNLEFSVGDSRDSHCFDYAIFQHEGVDFLALHSTINSDSGSFIQDGDYVIVNLQRDGWECEALGSALHMVGEALEWMAMPVEAGDVAVIHDRTGSNQDPYYFVRALARDLNRHVGFLEGDGIAAESRNIRAMRYGGAKLNRAIEQVCPGCRVLPISRRPKLPEFQP